MIRPIDKAGTRQNLVFLTDPKDLEKQATIMELYYSGDKIGYLNLGKQFNLGKQTIKFIVSKYKPRLGTRDITICIGSKINDMWGEEDIDISALLIEQESPVELI